MVAQKQRSAIPISSATGETRRDGLRCQVMSRRETLTPTEASFLDLVLDLGTDIEVELAHEKLLDDRLFFDPFKKSSISADDSSNTFSGPAILPPSLPAPQHMGSSRRLECLERRRASTTHTSLWKTREAGLETPGTNAASPVVSPFVAKINPLSIAEAEACDKTVAKQHWKSLRASFRASSALRSSLEKNKVLPSLREHELPDNDDDNEEEEDDDEKKNQRLDETGVNLVGDADERDDKHDDDGQNLFQSFKDQSASSSRKLLDARSASVNFYAGEGFELGEFEELEAAIESASGSDEDEYDPWKGDTHMGANNSYGEPQDTHFYILGTTAEDENCKPHVLSPLNMESLQSVLPYSKRGESFWLKYSMVRDGSSALTFLQKVRGSKYTLLALETLDGEVFGAFTSEPWHIDHGYFGTGECFLWRMRQPRSHSASCILEQAKNEGEIDVHKCSNENEFFQICHHNRLSVGGGSTSQPREIGPKDGISLGGESSTLVEESVSIVENEWGFALAFEDGDMMSATSSPCITFNSPSLSKMHSDGSRFELINLEAWALTPCITMQEAQIMECGQLFLKRHMTI
jgi:hypothetical protein